MITYESKNICLGLNKVDQMIITDENFISVDVEYSAKYVGPNKKFIPKLPCTVKDMYRAAQLHQLGFVLNKFCLKYVTEKGLLAVYHKDLIINNDKLVSVDITYDEKEDWVPVKINGPYPKDWCIVQIYDKDKDELWYPNIGEYRPMEKNWRIKGCFQDSNEILDYHLCKRYKVIAWRNLPPKYKPPIGTSNKEI